MNKKFDVRDFTSHTFSSDALGESMTKISHPSLPQIFVFPKKFKTSYALFGVKYGSIDNEIEIV